MWALSRKPPTNRIRRLSLAPRGSDSPGDDLVVSNTWQRAADETGGAEGRVWLLHAVSAGVIDINVDPVRRVTPHRSPRYSMALVGDIHGDDGLPELVLGAPYADTSVSGGGAAFIISGAGLVY
jgi:hypothetical protein